MREKASKRFFGWAWWSRVVLALVLLLLGVAWLHAGLQPDARDAVGFIVGVWGVLVTVIGLGVAIWQLQRSRSATEAAASAVQRLRNDVGMLDIIAEMGTCRQEIGSAIDKLNESSWRSACTHLAPVRSALNRIIAVPEKFPKIDIEAFKNHISFLIASETALEPLGNEAFDSADMRTSLRQISDSLGQLETILREDFGEH